MAKPSIVAMVDALVVVDKPSGVRTDGSDQPGVPDLPSWLDAQPMLPRGVRPVHRLDLTASGLVLCSADPTLRATLGDALAQGAIHKTYLVMVHGRTHRKGTIKRPLADARRGRPLAAITHYRTLAHLGPYSLLAVTIETGRKHQIRRHFHGLGHPVVGDTRYRAHRATHGLPDRLWLHARALEIAPGVINTDAHVFEAELPEELRASIAELRWNAGEE